MIVVHEILCLALFYSIFCRAVRMDASTHKPIRIVLQILGTVAALGMAAPVHWPSWTPDYFSLALLASITAVQLVTAHYWAKQMPPAFTADDKPQLGLFARGAKL